MFGLCMNASAPSITSERLCGGIWVAIPTAIPFAPLTSRFGMTEGRTDGSITESSKLGVKSTVSFSISSSRRSASAVMRHSV